MLSSTGYNEPQNLHQQLTQMLVFSRPGPAPLHNTLSFRGSPLSAQRCGAVGSVHAYGQFILGIKLQAGRFP